MRDSLTHYVFVFVFLGIVIPCITLCASPISFEVTLQKVIGLEEEIDPIPEGCQVFRRFVVRPVKVSSRKQLIRELSPDGKEETLGETALKTLSVYDGLFTPQMRERLAFAATVGSKKIRNGVIPVTISDLSKVVEAADPKRIESAFAASAAVDETGRNVVKVSSLDACTANGSGANKVLCHEISHMLDNNLPSSGLGFDMAHYIDEVTNPGLAWGEGWARFNELLDDPEAEPLAPYPTVKKECMDSTIKEPHYFEKGPESFLGSSLLEVEGVIASILYRIAMEIPDGKQIIMAAFRATNGKYRETPALMREILSQQPGLLGRIFRIVDEVTSGRLMNQDFKDFLGSTPALEKLLTKRPEPPLPLELPPMKKGEAGKTQLPPDSIIQSPVAGDGAGAFEPREPSGQE